MLIAVAAYMGSVLLSAQAVGATPAQTIAVLRIVSGPHGDVRNGEFVLDEQRTQFDPAKDKEVVVYFQWQGPPGAHRMIAQWKSPDGASSTTSPIDYVARDRRFGAYWRMPLTPSAATGQWAIEATVDGQPGGRFSFELTPAAGGAPVAIVKRLPTANELFSRISAVFVVLERSTAKGLRLDPAAAYMGGHGRLFTSVAALDGADTITAILPDGRRQPITNVIAINRSQDWAIVSGGADQDVDQAIAADASVRIGDRVFSLEASGTAARVLMDGQISGRAGALASGPRFIMTAAGNASPPGEPVFNEFGELIGIVGGTLVAGTYDLSELLRFRAELRGSPVVPIALFRASLDAPATPISDMRARGDLLAAVDGSQNVGAGGFARGISKTSSLVPVDERREFSSKDKEFIVFITWRPQTRLKGMSTLRLYDESNRLVVDSKPTKIDIGADRLMLSNWKMSIPERPGVYRADVMIDGVPIWRGFVRITD
jgi:hypothetical protein